MKIRVKFSKHGAMKFIGHLDIMRYFQKAIVRANIDIAFSEGFNPHQIMSFAAPLGVGIVSDGEYMDIKVNSSMSSVDAINALNNTMVEGMKVLDYRLLPDNAQNAMSSVNAASYMIYSKKGAHLSKLQDKLNEFMLQNSINIIKKTKKQEIEMDLKPLIYDFKLTTFSSIDEELDNQEAFYLMISTGSESNIKPELVLDEFFKYANEAFDENEYQIYRLDVFTKIDDKYIPLNELGEKIEC